jgi:hypothetical protein
VEIREKNKKVKNKIKSPPPAFWGGKGPLDNLPSNSLYSQNVILNIKSAKVMSFLRFFQ